MLENLTLKNLRKLTLYKIDGLLLSLPIDFEMEPYTVKQYSSRNPCVQAKKSALLIT